MTRWRINAELAPTERGCVMRLRYEGKGTPKLAFITNQKNGSFRVDAKNRRVTGWTDQISDWQAVSPNFKQYFAAEFDCDIDTAACEAFGPDGKPQPSLSAQGEHAALFAALTQKNVAVRFAISYISEEQAVLNLERETSFDYDAVRSAAAEAWESRLSRIEAVTETEEDMRTFYSCLYRCFLYPHKCYELDANGKTVHYSPYDDGIYPGVRYTDTGFWDTFRTLFPLLSIIAPDDYRQIVDGFVADYRDNGWLPRWTSMGESGCMPSTLIDAVIADGAVKGILDGELLETAFEGMLKHSSTVSSDRHFGRNACAEYIEYDYVPKGAEYDVVNLTLDFAYGDFCIAQIARILNRTDIEAVYRRRALNYKNLFDPDTGFMRCKKTDGSFTSDFDQYQWFNGYTEGCAWQNSFFVPHDTEGFAALHGGMDKLCAKIDKLFAAPPIYDPEFVSWETHEMTEVGVSDLGQCAISNQPSHHIPYIYAACGQPEKTCAAVKKICSEYFDSSVEGFPGDEDNGSMSSWYIFGMLGFYPYCPGKPEYLRSRSQLKSVRINGKPFDCSAWGATVPHSAFII